MNATMFNQQYVIYAILIFLGVLTSCRLVINDTSSLPQIEIDDIVAKIRSNGVPEFMINADAHLILSEKRESDGAKAVKVLYGNYSLPSPIKNIFTKSPLLEFRIEDVNMQCSKNHSFVVRIKERKNPNDVLQFLLQNGVGIHSFNEILPSLNDIFIRLVEGTPTARKFEKVNS